MSQNVEKIADLNKQLDEGSVTDYFYDCDILVDLKEELDKVVAFSKVVREKLQN